ncbi:Regulator of rDNA transcription protein 15 [Capsicum baccatum]|uniref:Regulator of rDNA transcription protein 15 n=1 Tax=Capsicum baccatum TaxID=33114 RepID=A0A2G2V0N5_CAPBA|nr:Regulator of rDNA transcription protein 15 [Capsicum baccatum]
MIGRADTEGSKSNVAMNAWLPQASYPCGNSFDTSTFEFRRSKGSLGHAFRVRIHTGSQNQTSFYPNVPHEISVLLELILGHLHYLLTNVPPQPNSPPDNVFRLWIPLVRTSSELAVQHAGSISSSPPTADGLGTGTPVPSPQSQSFSRSYGSILLTSLAYIVPSTIGCSPWRPDAVMSTTERGRHSVLRIFKGRRERIGYHTTYGALPAAGPYLRLCRFWALDGIHHPIWTAFPDNPTRRQRLVVGQGPSTTGLSPSPAPPSRGLGPESNPAWPGVAVGVRDARWAVVTMARRVELQPPLAAMFVDVDSYFGQKQARGAREASIHPAMTAHPMMEERCEGRNGMHDAQAEVPSA